MARLLARVGASVTTLQLAGVLCAVFFIIGIGVTWLDRKDDEGGDE